jgi:hypothetical protein
MDGGPNQTLNHKEGIVPYLPPDGFSL